MIRNRSLPVAFVALLVATLMAPQVATGSAPVQAPPSRAAAPAALASDPSAPPSIQHDETQPLRLGGASVNKNPKADSSVAAVLQSQQLHGSVAALGSAEAHGLSVAGGKVRVIIEAADAKAAQKGVAATGADIEGTAANLIQALATPGQLRDVLGLPSVGYVRAPLPRVADAVTDEAVATVNASTWQQRGQSGAGVKIAIIDLGFAGYASAQASGDLPAPLTTVDECEGELATGTEHGTAVAEIVHKMAPGARLYLICVSTEVDLATAEEYAKANGITIVSHSVSWFNTSRGDGTGEPGTPDAIVADARANGILWVNSAGNSGQGHWSGAFVDNGQGWNLFAAGDLGNGFYLPAGASTCVSLKWDDWPVSSQDFDLFIARSADSTVVAYSENLQDGSQPPTEGVCLTNDGAGQAFFVAIGRYATTASPRFDLFLTAGTLQYQVAAGSVTEPASSPAALAVGAACWRGTAIEPFSSRGPTIDKRIKPDLTGPDQVSTATYGASSTCASESGFAGTSAAAPHVAGAAALVKGAYPSDTAAQIQSYLQARAMDLGAVGNDSVFGYGLLRLPTVAFVPGAPSGVKGAGYNTAVVVTWTAPRTDGGSPITGYAVTASPGGTTCSTAGALSCKVSGLTNGTPYTFTVRAGNAVGQGPASPASSPVTPNPGPPFAPTGVSATRGDLSATVAWKVPDANGSPISGYTVTSSPESKACTTTTQLSCAVTGLTNGRAYTFTVAATNGLGTGPASTASNSVTPAGLPLAPAGVQATPFNSSALVSWAAAADNGSPITGYTATAAPGGMTCSTTGALSCTVAGLANGTPYTFTVTATNSVGTGPASAPSAVVAPKPVPGAPGAVSALGTDASAVVTWAAPIAGGGSPITGYTVTSAPDGRTCVWTAGPLACTVSGLTNRTPYTFTVTATNSVGTGPASAPSAVVTPLPGATYHALTPVRLLDSRIGNGLTGAFKAKQARTFQVTGRGGVPANATGVTGNLTVTGQTAGGYLYLGPVATNSPTSSTLNFPLGDTRANGVTVALGTGGKLSVTYMAGTGKTAQVVFDVTGYFTPDASGATYHALAPVRLLDSRIGNGLTGAVQGEGGPDLPGDRPGRGACQRHRGHRQPHRDRPDRGGLPVPRSRRHEQPHELDAQLPARRHPGQRGHGRPGHRGQALGHLHGGHGQDGPGRLRRHRLLHTRCVRGHVPRPRPGPPARQPDRQRPHRGRSRRRWPGPSR